MVVEYNAIWWTGKGLLQQNVNLLHWIIINNIIIIIILSISFMQGIYTYIPETNHVPREQCVVTMHGAYIASSCVDSIVSLR